MKKTFIVLLVIILTAVPAYLIFSQNSLSIAVSSAGYSPGDMTVLERGFDDNGREFRVVKTAKADQTDKNDDLTLLYLEKKDLGFWKLSYTAANTSADVHLVTIGWLKTAGVRRYEVNEDPAFSTEWHILYCGNNAVKPIDITAEQLPPGVAFNVQQAGSEFVIHLVSYEEPDTLNKIDIHSLLIDTDSISE